VHFENTAWEHACSGPWYSLFCQGRKLRGQNVYEITRRSRLGSENTTLTTISEYELPLDPDWEWPRSYLTLGQVLGEGEFGKVSLT
jgi:hypothetical protein